MNCWPLSDLACGPFFFILVQRCEGRSCPFTFTQQAIGNAQNQPHNTKIQQAPRMQGHSPQIQALLLGPFDK